MACSDQSPPAPPEIPVQLQQIESGKRLFEKSWTHKEGAGHRNTMGVVDMSKAERMGSNRLNFELFATPAVTSCTACHSVPFSISGGAGHMITNVIVVRKSSKNASSDVPRKDEVIVNASAPTSMFGSGFVEMLARQISQNLAKLRDTLGPGDRVELEIQGLSFGWLRRHVDGRWDSSEVHGLPFASIKSSSPTSPPTLIIRPFHQTGSIKSLREFTINAFDFHLGMQASERFGINQDPDRDGVENELSPEQIDNIVMYQATLSVPEKILPTEPNILQQAIYGEKLFADFKCSACHRPYLALNNNNWIFSDYDYEGNLRSQIDLTSAMLPGKRPKVVDGAVSVPVYSDFKLHDITDGIDSQDRDALSMRTVPGSDEFFAGTSHFITPRLWGVGNQPPYFHNGRHTSLREAIEAHAGEAHKMRDSFLESDSTDQDALIVFLKTLQIQQPNRAN